MINFIRNVWGQDLPHNEAQTKQAIILPMLGILGWNTANINEVHSEYNVGNGRVDYSLRIGNLNKVFLEVKTVGEDLERHREQLTRYSYEQGVKLAILTNGTKWEFYLPLQEGIWNERMFTDVDIEMREEIENNAQILIDFLRKDNIQNGMAYQKAEEALKKKHIKREIDNALPQALEGIIAQPDTKLVDLLCERVEEICGYKPESEHVVEFIHTHLIINSLIPDGQPVERGIQRPDAGDVPAYIRTYLGQINNQGTLGYFIRNYIRNNTQVSYAELIRAIQTNGWRIHGGIEATIICLRDHTQEIIQEGKSDNRIFRWRQ